MLDTLQIKKCYTRPLSDDYLRGIGAIPIQSRRNRIFALNPVKDYPTLPRLTIIFTPDGIMHVSAECSIPKLLFGNNSRLPDEEELSTGLELISEYTSETTGLEFNSFEANVSIAHFANDVQLGEPGVYAAVNRLSRLKLNGLLKHAVDDTTIYFNNKSREVRIYPKLQEVYSKAKVQEAIDHARGNLRFEYCLLNKYGVDSHAKKFGLRDSMAKSILTSEVSDRVFRDLFTEMDFPSLLTDERSNLQKLKGHFRGRKAMTLDGFLNTVDQYGELFYKDTQHGFKKGAYYRAVRDCRKAGVWRSGN